MGHTSYQLFLFMQWCSIKKLFINVLQDSQGNDLCCSLFFNKAGSLPVNFAKFLRTVFYRTRPGQCFCYLNVNIIDPILAAPKLC